MEHGHDTGCGCRGEGGHGEGGCCHHAGHPGRFFYTREEKAAHLEKYLEQLKAEAAGVEEELARLRKD